MPPPPPATAAPNRAQLAKESDAAEKRRKVRGHCSRAVSPGRSDADMSCRKKSGKRRRTIARRRSGKIRSVGTKAVRRHAT
jgi:hypothetical protein